MSAKINLKDPPAPLVYDGSSQRDERDERRAWWAYATALVCGAGFWAMVGLAFARSRGWL